jgi:hypothetical protein
MYLTANPRSAMQQVPFAFTSMFLLLMSLCAIAGLPEQVANVLIRIITRTELQQASKGLKSNILSLLHTLGEHNIDWIARPTGHFILLPHMLFGQ